MHKIGQRVEWSVYGLTFTGTIDKIMPASEFYKAGDMFVLVDPEHAQYAGQRALVAQDVTII